MPWQAAQQTYRRLGPAGRRSTGSGRGQSWFRSWAHMRDGMVSQQSETDMSRRSSQPDELQQCSTLPATLQLPRTNQQADLLASQGH